MFKTVKPALSRQRKTYSQSTFSKVFNVSPKITLNQVGQKVIYSAEQQVIDMFFEKGSNPEAERRLFDALELERERIFKEAQKKYENRIDEFSKEMEKEKEYIRLFSGKTLDDYLKGLKDKVKNETIDILYVDPSRE